MPLGEPIILEPQFALPIFFKYTDFYMKKMLPHFQLNFLKLLFSVRNLMLLIGFKILLIS